jgi:hypothetical protein
MSATGSDKAPADAPTPFVERDDAETHLGYDHGGVPFYIAIAWAALIVVYLVVMFWIALPDFKTWQGP